MEAKANDARRQVKVVCPHACPDTCVMTVAVEGDRAVALGGDAAHRFTAGFLCAKVNRYLERVYSPERILHPMRRVAGGRGSSPWTHSVRERPRSRTSTSPSCRAPTPPWLSA